MTDREVSVVLPAYNEAGTLEHTVEVTLTRLAEFLPAGSFEVLIAEDGCDDRTPEVAAALAASDERIRHIHSDERRGRGGALTRAFAASNGDVVAYFDTDLATDISHLETLIDAVRSDGYAVATGSRWLPGNVPERPMTRDVASRGYNTLVRVMLRSSIQDHQCGFKAFDRDVLCELLQDIEDDHWFWDTEVLVQAQRRGYDVLEFPVEWEPKGDTSVDLMRDVFGMGSQIIRLWWQLAVRPRITRRVTVAAGTLLVLVAAALMTVYLDPTAVLTAMRAADPVYIGVAAAVYLLSWPLRGARYRDILAELGYHERVGFLTGAIFISQTGNLVFPARAGDAVRAYVVKARRQIPYPSGFASLAIERVFDLLSLTVLAGATLLGLAVAGIDVTTFGAVSAPAAGERSGRTALYVAASVGAAALVVVGAIVWSARSDRNRVRAILRRVSDDHYVERIAVVIEQFLGDVQVIARDRRAFAVVGATSLVIWGLDVATALVVFAAFGVALGTGELVAVGLFAVSVGNLAKVLPLSPGGIGLYEGAFSLIVVALTPVGWAVALAAAIVDHAVKNVVTLVGGVGATVVLNVSLTTAVDESGEVDADSPVQE